MAPLPRKLYMQIRRRTFLASLFPAALLAQSTDERITGLAKQVAAEPANHNAKVSLALEYLQKLRETGDGRYLELSAKIIDALLSENPAEFAAMRVRNEINLQLHRFRKVADDARRMLRTRPADTAVWGNLGDALMELGEYDNAGQAYGRMMGLRPGLFSYNRLAYHRFVTGDAKAALTIMQAAIDAGSPIPEQVAWCMGELGDMHWKTGSVESAEASYHSGIKLHASLHRAHAGLGRIAWSKGKLPAAMEHYKKAQSILPLPEYAAALEDLYMETGDGKSARNQQALGEATTKLAQLTGEKANRVLALIYVDHDRHLDTALDLVMGEFENRDDVYTYDALSWVHYKLGNLEKARDASAKAIRLKTPEPTFYFHAGMIAANQDAGRGLLSRALELNPNFDNKQAALVRKALSQ